jgi:maltooligosyltrehalose trehalohydrolase
VLTPPSDLRPSEARARVPVSRRLPIGAEIQQDGVHFRVWAPDRRRVEVVLEEPAGETPGAAFALARETDGYFAGLVERAHAGSRYRFRLDGEAMLYPDPACRFAPDGPHGASEVIDPRAFAWTDGEWPGVRLAGQVMYELHVGTFTPEGTWDSARGRLPHLRDLGVTTIEVMPVAAFPGAFGWGYDGVSLYAPHQGYGRPDDLRRFVDEAHGFGLAVILDVVYNHLGPDGNYLRAFSPRYFSARTTEWGEALNYDGPDSAPVRELIVENAGYWIAEFHFDGLRLDATQSIFDSSADHVLAALTRRARAAAGSRNVIIAAENEAQQTHLVRQPSEGGYGLDALWNDDFHHTARVALTGQKEAYYSDYLGSPQELVSSVKHGFLYQGQWYLWQKKTRGSSTRGLPSRAFIAYLENHDQVANSCTGERLWRLTTPGRHRAMTALLLLGPWTPLLFQGQEWSSDAVFTFFADHEPQLAALVRKGRFAFLSQFGRCATPEIRDRLPDPADPATAAACRLDWDELADAMHHQSLALHRDLLALRRSDPVIAAQGTAGVAIDGAVLAAECFLLRFTAPDGADRLLLVNLGRDLALAPAPEPLLAPPGGCAWLTAWSSEDPRYGGTGTPKASTDGGWDLAGHAAVLLRAEKVSA